MANPQMCPHCRAFVDPGTRVCPYCEGEIAQRRREPDRSGSALRGLVPETHFTTFIILALNFGVFIATLTLSSKYGGSFLSIDGRVLEVFGWKERFAILAAGQWWRLITAGLLHGGVMHILMNSWAMYDLGAQVEHVFGTARYLAIYIFSSIIGFYASLQLNASPSVGASAALCGLIGAMMGYARRTNQSFVWSFYLRWVIILAVLGFVFPMVDNAAHFGGFAAGFLMGWIASGQTPSRAADRLWAGVAGALGLVVLWAVGMAYLNITSKLTASL